MSSLMIAPDKPMTDARHVPVLVEEVLDLLCPSEARIVLDGTFGAGSLMSSVTSVLVLA